MDGSGDRTGRARQRALQDRTLRTRARIVDGAVAVLAQIVQALRGRGRGGEAGSPAA